MTNTQIAELIVSNSDRFIFKSLRDAILSEMHMHNVYGVSVKFDYADGGIPDESFISHVDFLQRITDFKSA